MLTDLRTEQSVDKLVMAAQEDDANDGIDWRVGRGGRREGIYEEGLIGAGDWRRS